MTLSLVILAAGRGSRFGGNKQLAVVGPDGQSLFEYSVCDACEAGFDHIVFVVSKDQDTGEFSRRLTAYHGKLRIDFVIQDVSTGVSPEKLDVENTPRTKPWGTAHAVLVCQPYIDNPFAVINADDFYGSSNYRKIASYLLANQSNPTECVMPGYRLSNTLSASGGVNRGMCTVSEDGYLESISEVKNIHIDSSGRPYLETIDPDLLINEDSIVSMTFWGFQPSLFALFDTAFRLFLDNTADRLNDEFYIPDVVDLAISSGLAKVKVLETSEKWKGLTFADDIAEVRAFLDSAGGYVPLH